MNAISLWQPWASAMAFGLKHNETRHWTTRYRGPLVIHAAKRPMRGEFDFLAPLFRAEDWKRMPYGALLCVVDLQLIRRTEDLADHDGLTPRLERLSDLEHILGNYEPGRFAWQTKLLHVFDEPIPFKGSQGFFDVPDDLVNFERLAS